MNEWWQRDFQLVPWLPFPPTSQFNAADLRKAPSKTVGALKDIDGWPESFSTCSLLGVTKPKSTRRES
jgi:hypothetical protein